MLKEKRAKIIIVTIVIIIIRVIITITTIIIAIPPMAFAPYSSFSYFLSAKILFSLEF